MLHDPPFSIAPSPPSCWLSASPLPAAAQTAIGEESTATGSLERIRVHGTALEGNLSGDDADRDVVVYLPPSYSQETTRHYPVVYFLHGYTVGAETYVRMLDLPASANRAIASGGVREMIVVLPDAYTIYSGSMYSSSLTTGDWEQFVAHDLVAFIDSHYRTLPDRHNRGLSGHSMGGYGTLRIGMKRPEAFSALYAMSSCCLMNDPTRFLNRLDGDEAPKPVAGGGFENAIFAQAAAWAANPRNPPLYLDLPIQNGEIQPLIAAKWAANSPLVMVDQYVPSLRRYRAIALDVGGADRLGDANHDLDAALTRLGVPHTFEEYEGDHTNRVRARFETKVLPFFSSNLTSAD